MFNDFTKVLMIKCQIKKKKYAKLSPFLPPPALIWPIPSKNGPLGELSSNISGKLFRGVSLFRGVIILGVEKAAWSCHSPHGMISIDSFY